MVEREGFEPSKAHGRQVYSLLRLTASLPLHFSTCAIKVHCPKVFIIEVGEATPKVANRGAGEGI